MQIDYTEHALQRIKERSISKKETREAFFNGKKEDVAGGLRRSVYKTKKVF